MDGPEKSLFSRLGPDAPPVGSLQAEIVLPALGSVKIEDLGDRIRMWGDDGQSEVIAKTQIRVVGQRGALLKLEWNGDEVMMDFGTSAAALEAVDTLDVPPPHAVTTQPAPSISDPIDEVAPAAVGSRRRHKAERKPRTRRSDGPRRWLKRVAVGLLVVGILAGAIFGGIALGSRFFGAAPEASTEPESPDVVIRTVSGSEDAEFSPFSIAGPWAVRWQTDGTGTISIAATAADGSVIEIAEVTGRERARVEITETGTFVVTVNTTGEMDWLVTVLEPR